MGKEYTRNASLIDEAQAELRAVQADHVAQVRERERLLQQVSLLESSVAKDDSLTALVHRMMLRAAAAQEAAAEEAGPGPANGQAADAPPVQLDLQDLPLSLLGYHNELLQRASNMTLENLIQIYKAFVERVLRAVSHIQCHGDQSYEKQLLTETVARFSNLLLLHGFLQLPVQRKYFTLNFMTLQEEEAPAGWYTRISRLIPVHRNFAGLVQAGISCLQKSVDKKVQPGQGGDVLQQLQQLLQLPGGPAVSEGLNMATLEQLVDACGRSATSVLLLRTMVSTYIFAGSLRFFDAVVVGQALSSCWPYSPRGMVVYEEYCKRDDVQAVLLQQPQDALPVAQGSAGQAVPAPVQQQPQVQQQQQQQQQQRRQRSR